MSKDRIVTVPLVVYPGGERKVIGEATVNLDTMEITSEIESTYFQELFKMDQTEFSIYSFEKLPQEVAALKPPEVIQ